MSEYLWYQEEVEDSTKLENKILKDYFSELEKIKKSNPKEKLVPKVASNSGGFFSKLFRSIVIEEEKIYENINVEGYISINQLIEILYAFLDYIYIESNKIIKKYKSIKGKNGYCYFSCFSTYSSLHESFIIAHFEYDSALKYEKKQYGSASEDLNVSFEKFPSLKDGNPKEYDLLKEDIFRLIPFLKLYQKIYSKNEYNKIAISNNTYLKILFDNQNDVFRGEYPTIKLEIADIAMVEYSKKDTNIEKYLSYAEDLEVLEELKKEEKKLFYSCYVPNDLEIVKLLKKLKLEDR